MRARLRQLKTALGQFLEWTVIGLMATLVLDVLWQVASRYLLRNPSSWTDELASLLIIWIALLGSSVAFIRNQHLGLDYFAEKLAPPSRRIAELAAHTAVAFFAIVVLIYGGIQLVTLTLLTGQVSPALAIPMGYVYLALPLSGAFILVASFEAFAARLAEIPNPNPNPR